MDIHPDMEAIEYLSALSMTTYRSESGSSDESDEDWNPVAVRNEILARDMLRIGLFVRSNEDSSRAIFPSPQNYRNLVSQPYYDSRTHSLHSLGLALRDQLESKDISGIHGTDVFRMCSMIPTSAPPCRYGYALLNNAGEYTLRCPACSSRSSFGNYYSFFQHCYNTRQARYPGTAHNFHNEWTDLSDDPRELHVAIANTVKRERERIIRLFFKEEIVEILRSQPSFEDAPADVTDYIMSLAYQLEDADLRWVNPPFN